MNTPVPVAHLDIGSRAPYPAGALSNFTAHAFVFRGLPVASMEGLLQGLKYAAPDMQQAVMALVGIKAKRAGKRGTWKADQTLYWQGTPIDRHGAGYQALLDEAFRAMFEQNHSARAALLSTGDAVLVHSIGRCDERETVLTRAEFCARLMVIRAELRSGA